MINDNKSISNVQRTGILITLLAAAFITSMSTTVTANMIPNFTEYFGVSSNLAQWLTSGATLISGITIPITAFLIKRVPNKIYFFSAMTAFTVGSLTAVLSVNFPMLLASRLFQAVGCGMLLSFAQIVLLKLYPKERHGTIMGAYSMAAMVSSVVGPTYAGLILDSFGWKGVFASLFMVGMLIIICGIIFMKNITDRETADLNIMYVSLSSFGFAAFLIGVSNISGGLLSFKSGGLILAGLLLLGAFTILQLRSEKPMLNLRVFGNAGFRIAVILSLCMYLICMGNAMILPIFSKAIRGFSDTSYGLATIVGSVLSVITTLSAGRLYDKVGIKPMFVVGTGLFAVYSVMGFLFSQNTSIIYIAVAFAVQTIAMSSLNSPATAMALSGLEGKERVDGSAIFNTLRQISSSLASTLAVLIYTLTGSNMTAVHGVYVYFGLVTIAIAVAVILYLKTEEMRGKISMAAKVLILWLLGLLFFLIHACYMREGCSLLLLDIRTNFVDNPELIMYYKNKLILLTAGCAVLLAAVFVTEDFRWRVRILKWRLTIDPQSDRFRRVCNRGLVLLALALIVVGFPVAKPEIARVFSEGWRGDALIAHACGGIDGQPYSNSVEAFEQSYVRGMRTIEVDFRLTSDDKLVCCHTWNEQLCGDYEAGHIYSEEEFLNIRIYDRYTPMSLETLLELMKKYEDVWIVTDTKYWEEQEVQKEFGILLETAEATDSMEVLDRFVIQLYTHEMYDMVEEIHSFPSYILTLYMIGGVDGEHFTEHCRFLADREIGSVTMWYYWVTPEVMEIADRYGISVYVHTVNLMEDLEELRDMGVKGFYTDDIYPEMLD